MVAGARIPSPAAWVFAIYLAGSILLPIAAYGAYAALPDPTLEVLGNALPYGIPWNRSAYLGLLLWAIALGTLVWQASCPRDSSWIRAVIAQISAYDGLMALLVFAPAISGIFNPSPWYSDFEQSLYWVIVWGGPYAAARTLPPGANGLGQCFFFLLVLGLGTIVVGMVEFAMGRFLYREMYGWHPFQSIGEVRYFGYRPLLLFEDPNQMGMWWLTLAIVGLAWFDTTGWFHVGTRSSLKNFKRQVLAGLPIGIPFLFQTAGASLLTLFGGFLLFLPRQYCSKKWLVRLMVAAVALFALRGPILTTGRYWVERSAWGQHVKGAMRRSSIGSLGWRLAREEQSRALMMRYPVFGWGSLHYWKDNSQSQRPWGMISLVMGAYGMVGVAACFGVLFFPLYSAISMDTDPTRLPVRRVIPILMALHGMDAFLNSAFFLPMVYLVGLTGQAGFGNHPGTETQR